MTHDRDELARLLNDSDPEHGVPVPDDDDEPYAFWYDQAEAILAAGWRKKPERDAMARAIFELQYHSTHWRDAGDLEKNDYRNRADAILALLDGPTETGEK